MEAFLAFKEKQPKEDLHGDTNRRGRPPGQGMTAANSEKSSCARDAREKPLLVVTGKVRPGTRTAPGNGLKHK
jgi:hypothetical protein